MHSAKPPGLVLRRILLVDPTGAQLGTSFALFGLEGFVRGQGLGFGGFGVFKISRTGMGFFRGWGFKKPKPEAIGLGAKSYTAQETNCEAGKPPTVQPATVS